MNFEWSKKTQNLNISKQKKLRFQFIKNDSTVEVEWKHYFPIFLI